MPFIDELYNSCFNKILYGSNKSAYQSFSTLGLNNPQEKENIIKLKLFDI